MHSDPSKDKWKVSLIHVQRSTIKSKPKMTSSEYSLHSSSIIKSSIAKAHKARKIYKQSVPACL